MAPISTTIDVARAPDEAFAYVTDPSRFGEWQRGVLAGSGGAEAPYSVGDRCVTTRKIGFAQRPVTSEITHIDPPRTWGVCGVDGPIRARVDVTVEPLEEGRRSRVKIDLDFTGHGIGKLIVPLFVRPSAKKEMDGNVKTLKARLERGGR